MISLLWQRAVAHNNNITRGKQNLVNKMGLLDKLSSLFRLKKREVKVLVVGLNNSGKSTVLNHLKSDDDKITVEPTVGLNVEKFKRVYFRYLK